LIPSFDLPFMLALLLAALSVTGPLAQPVDTVDTMPERRVADVMRQRNALETLDVAPRTTTAPEGGGDVVGPRRTASLWTTTTPEGADTTRRRPVAVEYSDAYATRLTIHRLASYTMLPLFGVEYALGQKLLTNSTPSTRGQHRFVGGAIAALFGINTVTGLWNLWDARHDENGRTKRTVHTVLMLAADAGFVATGAIANSARNSHDEALTHRRIALGSMAVATVGSAMMWFWKN